LRLNNVILVAGLGFFMLSFFIMGLLPWIQGAGTKPAPYLTDYNELELEGRRIYIREVCWHCHTQFVRPVGGESERYGPVSRTGEYVFDKPHLFGTRRVGPDLAREGGKRPDGWHVAHLKNPQALVSVSVMPKYTWLTDDEIKALVAYLQKLGTGIGDWRKADIAEAQEEEEQEEVPQAAPSPELIAKGKQIYHRLCIGCHGADGDGKGPVAAVLTPKPADFTDEDWKHGGSPQEVFNTLTKGVPGTAMAPFGAQLSENDRWALVFFVKSFSK
jgi:cbb3-type cytochrome oxidase cytochrome c subunit